MADRVLPALKTVAEYLSNGRTVLGVLVAGIACSWQAFSYINDKLEAIDSVKTKIELVQTTLDNNSQTMGDIKQIANNLDKRLTIAEAHIAAINEEKKVSNIIPFDYPDSTQYSVGDGKPGSYVEVALPYSITRDDCKFTFYRVILDNQGHQFDVSKAATVGISPTLVVGENQIVKFKVAIPKDQIVKGKAHYQSRVKTECADGGVFTAHSPKIPFNVL